MNLVLLVQSVCLVLSISCFPNSNKGPQILLCVMFYSDGILLAFEEAANHSFPDDLSQENLRSMFK